MHHKQSRRDVPPSARARVVQGLACERLLLIAACTLTFLLAAPYVLSAQGTITTVAGTLGSPGFSGDGGPATGAQLSVESYGVAIDSAGNVFIADTVNQRIRKVTKSNGVITTIAGTGTAGFSGDGGPATAARLNNPLSVAVDAAGNVYISDQNNDRIRRVTPGGTISTYAGSGAGNFAGDGGPATAAKLSHPFGLALDAAGNLFFADVGNHRIRRVATTGVITSVAGSGGPSGGTGGGTGGFAGDGLPATNSSVRLQNPSFVAVDGSGNLYIADELNERIRKVTASTGIISTVAGTGAAGYNGDNRQATTAQLNRPSGVAVDASGNVYIADYLNFRIRKITIATGVITTVAGIGTSGMSEDGIPATSAALADPVGVALDSSGTVYIMDQSSFRVRKVTFSTSPSGLTVTQTGPNSATVSWSPLSGASSYTLKFSNTAGGPKTVVTTTTSTVVGVPALVQGRPYYFVVSATTGGTQGPDSAEVLFIIPNTAPPRPTDIDGDGLGDLTVWRPGNGTWFSLTSSTGYSYGSSRARQWGNQSNGDVPLMGDIDGDRIADLVVWRASSGTWFWLTSSTGYSYAAAGNKQWGNQSLGDRPMLGDIDGDRLADLIVWRASSGTWYWLTSSSGYAYAQSGTKQWGSSSSGDVPKLGDIDGDGAADLMVWRAPSGTWLWLTSSSGYNYASSGAKQWGNQGNGDVPMVGDVDGDGKSDLVVWRAPTGTWFWLTSSTSYDTAAYGLKQWGNQGNGDVPLLPDLDGDGKADLTVWRAPSGTWHWLTSTSGYDYAAAGARQWGSQSNGDIPMVK